MEGKRASPLAHQSLSPHISVSSSCREQGDGGSTQGKQLAAPPQGWLGDRRRPWWGLCTFTFQKPLLGRQVERAHLKPHPRGAGSGLLPGTHLGSKPPAEPGNWETIRGPLRERDSARSAQSTKHLSLIGSQENTQAQKKRHSVRTRTRLSPFRKPTSLSCWVAQWVEHRSHTPRLQG